MVAVSDDLPRVLGPFFCWEIWPAFLGLSLLLMFRRSPAVVALSGRCLCVADFRRVVSVGVCSAVARALILIVTNWSRL